MKAVLREHWQSMSIVIVLGLVLAGLYFKSVQSNMADLYRVDSLTHQLIAVDSSMEGDMVMLASGRLAHFDSLTQGQAVLADVYLQLEHSFAGIPEIAIGVTKLRDTLDRQLTPLDFFKRRLSVYRNSVRYLPTLLTQMGEKHPEKATQWMLLYREIMLMSSQPTEFKDQSLKLLLHKLDDDAFKNVRKHLRIMLQAYSDVEAAMFEFIHCGTDDAALSLNENYHAWFDKEIKSSERYRLLLVVFSILLLIYVTTVLWRLQRSASDLKSSHLFLHYLQKAMDEHAIVAITDRQGNITFANDKFCAISGYTNDELIGTNHRLIKSDEHDQAFFTQMWTTISAGKTWHGIIKNKKKTGEDYWVDTTITPFLNEQGEPWQYIAVRTDFTARVQVEKALHESHEHYRLLTASIPEPLGLIQKGQWVYLNPAAVSMFGEASEADLLHAPVLDFVSIDSKATMVQTIGMTQSQKQTVDLQEIELVTKQGKVFAAEFQTSPLLWEDEAAVLIAMHDISARKQDEAERRLYGEQLEHSQRLESLGVLAGGIAHDFNNILTSILGNVSLAEMKMNEPKAALGYLKKVQTASERAAELCQQMLMYSGGGALEKKAISLQKLLSDVLDMAKTNMPARVRVEEHIATHLPAVEADSRQLQQVMLNLLTNAGEAIKGAGLVQVSLGVMGVDEAWLAKAHNGGEIDPGTYVYFEVKDTGVGMDSDTLTKVFDPFFSTKFTGRGLGMSAILGIVQSHKGAISLCSTRGEGATIRVILPASSSKAEDTPKRNFTHQAKLQGRGTILVVDDEEDIIDLIEAILLDVGFQVITAVDGQDGIAKFNAHHAEIDAVVCDMVMPNLGGAEVAKYIHAKDPTVKILLSSGYDEEAALKLPDGMLSGFIQKPYSPVNFLQAVFCALDIV